MSSQTTHSSDNLADSNGGPPTHRHTAQGKAEEKSSLYRKHSIFLWAAGVLGLVLAVVAVMVLLRATWFREPFHGATHTVKKEPMRVTIVERGSLESAENSDIIVRVKAGGRGSTNASTIKWVVDDGTQ